jgi:hypothetical protein
MENRIEDPDLNSQSYIHLIFDKKKPKTYDEEKTACSTNDCGITVYPPTEY